MGFQLNTMFAGIIAGGLLLTLPSCEYAQCLNSESIHNPACDDLTDPDISELLQREYNTPTATWSGNVNISNEYSKQVDFLINFDERSITAKNEEFSLDADFHYDYKITGTTIYNDVNGFANGKFNRNLKEFSGSLVYGDTYTGGFNATRP